VWEDLKPTLTFIDLFMESDFWLSVDERGKNDTEIMTERIQKFLIKHPDVNRKLLKAYLDLKMHKDGASTEIIGAPEKEPEMIALLERRMLEFVDILYEELAEQIPITKKKFLADHVTNFFDRLKKMQAECRKGEYCLPEIPFQRVRYSKFVRDFFESWDIGLKEDELQFMYGLAFVGPIDGVYRNQIYSLILDDRLYFTDLIFKVGKKGLNKENKYKLNDHRYVTLTRILPILKRAAKVKKDHRLRLIAEKIEQYFGVRVRNSVPGSDDSSILKREKNKE